MNAPILSMAPRLSGILPTNSWNTCHISGKTCRSTSTPAAFIFSAIRVESPDVFQATHQVPLELLAEGKASGIRIDHPDGLWNPRQYFRQLQETYVRERIRRRLSLEIEPENLVSTRILKYEKMGNFASKK